jgi:hypothetical protein
MWKKPFSTWERQRKLETDLTRQTGAKSPVFLFLSSAFLYLYLYTRHIHEVAIPQFCPFPEFS